MEKIKPFNYLKKLYEQRVPQYSFGLFESDVVEGYFLPNSAGKYQKIFFNVLLKQGFRRTTWQYIFPGQTAGIVKKIPPLIGNEKINECHVRFYYYGVIHAELEPYRFGFNFNHWQEPTINGNPFLEELIENITIIPDDIKKEIGNLFGERNDSRCFK